MIQEPWQQSCSYEFFLRNRYKISQIKVDGRSYEAICNNGFIKLYLPQMRAYWHVQNEFNHRLRDWKFHVSVDHAHVPKAWRLLIDLFVNSKCRGAMKVAYLPQCNIARGREITIYIYTFEEEYHRSSLAKDYNLTLADEHSQAFWFDFFEKAQEILQSNGIKSNGTANGDLGLGKYVSIRNQSYVFNEQTNVYEYPADKYGWNHDQQDYPFDLSAFLPSVRSRQTLGIIAFLAILLLL